MDEDFIKERAEERDYPEEATDDLLSYNEFAFRLVEFLQELIDDGSLSTDQIETAEEFISNYEDGLLED